MTESCPAIRRSLVPPLALFSRHILLILPQVLSGKLAHTKLWMCGGITPSSQKVPTMTHEPLSPLDGLNFVSCAAGAHHIVAATSAGDLFCWGSNDCGQLGLSTSTKPFATINIDNTTQAHEPAEEGAAAGVSDAEPAAAPPPPRKGGGPPEQMQLQVYRLNLKAMVTYVACGANHTLAALAPCGE